MNRSPRVDASAARSTSRPDRAPARQESAGERDSAVLRWANLLVWSLVALLATALGVVLIPLHLPGGFLVPVAPLVALVANYSIPKLMLAGTGWSGTRFIPSVVWVVIALVGAAPTGNGDLLISGDSHSSAIGLAYLGLGALGAMLGILFAASPMRRPKRDD